MNEKFIIISYYTFDTPYQEVCHKYLMPSVQVLKLNVDVRAVNNQGNWYLNTSYKPTFIRSMLDFHKKDVVFVDSDAQILEYPDLFENIPEQYCIAAHVLDKNNWYGRDYGSNRYELLSGTLWVKNCDESRKILEAWEKQCSATNTWEQKVLQYVLEQLGVKPFQLPLSYCYIKTMPNGQLPRVKVDRPVVVHNQVSRALKNKV